MKKYTFFLLSILIVGSIPTHIYAFTFPEIEKPNLNITLPTNTPTPTIKIQLIDPQINKIPGIQLITTPTAIPTVKPTEVPVTPSVTPAVTTTISETKESTTSPTVTNVQETKEATESQTMTKKDIVVYSLIAALILILIGQPLWPKIKEWLHKKTE